MEYSAQQYSTQQVISFRSVNVKASLSYKSKRSELALTLPSSTKKHLFVAVIIT